MWFHDTSGRVGRGGLNLRYVSSWTVESAEPNLIISVNTVRPGRVGRVEYSGHDARRFLEVMTKMGEYDQAQLRCAADYLEQHGAPFPDAVRKLRECEE